MRLCVQLGTALFQESGEWPALPPAHETDFALLTGDAEWALCVLYVLPLRQLLHSPGQHAHKLCGLLMRAADVFSSYYSRVKILTVRTEKKERKNRKKKTREREKKQEKKIRKRQKNKKMKKKWKGERDQEEIRNLQSTIRCLSLSLSLSLCVCLPACLSVCPSVACVRARARARARACVCVCVCVCVACFPLPPTFPSSSSLLFSLHLCSVLFVSSAGPWQPERRPAAHVCAHPFVTSTARSAGALPDHAWVTGAGAHVNSMFTLHRVIIIFFKPS